ncbi:laminin G domain protein, partial [Teladorsagia circumcincta]
FVPTFFGQESLVFPPLTDEQLRNLNVVLAVNPSGKDGVIFETARRPSLAGEDPAILTRTPNIEHRARIDHGLVVIHCVGEQRNTERVEHDSIDEQRFKRQVTLSVSSRKYQKIGIPAVLQLNSGPPTVKTHYPTKFEQGTNGPVFLGSHIEATDPEMVHQGFIGVISSMTVSGEPVDLGTVARSPEMVSYDSCQHGLCLHSSRCRNANNPKVSMDLKPEDVEHNRMLLYVAADYDPESKKHLSVSVSDGSIVYSYSDGEGREEIRTAPIEPGVEYTVVLSRNDSTTSLFINQQMYERKNEMKTFEPGTDLFVGGLPPGLDVPDDVPATSFFGCINKVGSYALFVEGRAV